jgi:small subunit ribosomal protein S7
MLASLCAYVVDRDTSNRKGRGHGCSRDIRNAGTSTEVTAQPPANPPPPQGDPANMLHHIPPASSPLLQFMTTLVMRHGEYAKAAKTVSRMLLHIYSLTRSPPMPIVEKAVEMASPVVRNKKMKKGGGKTSYVPQALNERQRTRRGIRWIISESGKKGKAGKTYAERMARQVIATVNGHEGTNKFKEEVHRLAMVNRYEASTLRAIIDPLHFFFRGVLPKR